MQYSPLISIPSKTVSKMRSRGAEGARGAGKKDGAKPQGTPCGFAPSFFLAPLAPSASVPQAGQQKLTFVQTAHFKIIFPYNIDKSTKTFL